MIPIEELRQRIGRTRIWLGAAIDLWDAGDLSRCQQCCTLLKSAIEELEVARVIVSSRGVTGIRDLSGQLDELRSETTRMMHVVDASTAFCRGMASRIGIGENANPEQLGNLHSVCTQG